MYYNYIIKKRFFSTETIPKLTINKIVDKISLKGKNVLVRADLNVPLSKKNHLEITDDTRIRSILPTIELLLKNQAKIILCSHLGRPKGKINENMRLTPVASHLSNLLGNKVNNLTKIDDCIGTNVKNAINKMKNKDILLLENLRFHPEEEKNDPIFSSQLASNMDVYVNDAFGTAHRAHASTVGVTNYIKNCVAGFLLEKELKYLLNAVKNPKRPLAAIIGGTKVSTKIPVLESLIENCDKILLGGGMIFTFYRAMGYNVGKSIVEDDKVQFAAKLIEKAKKMNVELLLPLDIIVGDKFDPDAKTDIVSNMKIPNEWYGLDIGPKTVALYNKKLIDCHTIIWNGPMGVFEFEKFAHGTNNIAKILAQCTDKGAVTIVGGGDSVAAVEQSGLASKMSHISTGGGASLELLEGKNLPGVAALTDDK